MPDVEDVRELRLRALRLPAQPGCPPFPYGLQSAIYDNVGSGSEVSPVRVPDLGAFVAEQEPLLRCRRIEHVAEA
ncbi:unannotated protein [freshwater metagenome]|uniref:Unannotated protein n=1 Tax=freshwater metagenome TaxID=449393 RepID=A0A6J6CQG6_9ZZZZ